MLKNLARQSGRIEHCLGAPLAIAHVDENDATKVAPTLSKLGAVQTFDTDGKAIK